MAHSNDHALSRERRPPLVGPESTVVAPLIGCSAVFGYRDGLKESRPALVSNGNDEHGRVRGGR